MKKYKQERKEVISRYSTYTLDELIEILRDHSNAISDEFKESIRFEIDVETYEYDSAEYPKLFMTWNRLETDVEEQSREEIEKKYQLAKEERERVEFERLSKKFSK